MARIACLMMQKDEILLLRPWLLYHGYLFGYENLFVWDNGSTESGVKDTLAQFKELGVNIDASQTTPDGFSNKGNIFSEVIRQFRIKNRYDVALPLDCDEFVAVAQPGGFGCARNEILSELARIDWHHLICRTDSGLYSLPGAFDEFQRVGHEKSVAAVRAFDSIDHGFHQATLPEGAQYAPTSLVYLHLHYRPYAYFIASARDKLRPWTDPDDLAGLKNYEGVGKHLVRYLFMTEAEYYAVEFEGAPKLKFTGLSDFLNLHMDLPSLRRAWGDRAAPVEHNFEALHAAGLKAMEVADHATAAQIWARCRAEFPDREEGYLYGAVAAKAAGDDMLLGQIHAAQARIFPDIFN